MLTRPLQVDAANGFAQPFTAVDDCALQTDSRFNIARDALVNGRPYALDAATQYLASLDAALPEIARVTPSPLPDEDVLRSLTQLKPCIDQLRWFVHLLARHADDEAFLTGLIEAFGKLLRFKVPPVERGTPNLLRCDNFRFVLWEVFLSTVAVLLREQRWHAASELMAGAYQWQQQGGHCKDSYVAFDGSARTLEQFRRTRLRISRGSPSVELLKQRANHAFCSFEDIMQADFVLCLRRLLHHAAEPRQWFPRTLIHAQARLETGFEVFARDQSGQHFEAVATLLDVADKAELIERFAAARNYHPERWGIGDAPLPFERLMALPDVSGGVAE